jgi:ubiquitin C-terminal hydrolase
MFDDYEQHDAHEFTSTLLSYIHEDCNRVKVKPYVDDPEEVDIMKSDYSDQQLSMFNHELKQLRDQSFIRDIFAGQYMNTITCLECKIPLKKFEDFITMPVPIP